MSNLFKINNMDKETAMLVFLSNLESRGIPMTLFVARLRGIEVKCNPIILSHLDNAILWAGGKEVWLSFLVGCSVNMGAKEDFC